MEYSFRVFLFLFSLENLIHDNELRVQVSITQPGLCLWVGLSFSHRLKPYSKPYICDE